MKSRRAGCSKCVHMQTSPRLKLDCDTNQYAIAEYYIPHSDHVQSVHTTTLFRCKVSQRAGQATTDVPLALRYQTEHGPQTPSANRFH